MLFSDWTLQVMPRTHLLDHNPVCLRSLGSGNGQRANRSFRFEAMWLRQEDFKSFLTDSWATSEDIEHSLAQFRSALGPWNKEIFGIIESQKQRLLSRLEGIQRSNAYPHSEFLYKLEVELHGKLNRLLVLEELNGSKKLVRCGFLREIAIPDFIILKPRCEDVEIG